VVATASTESCYGSLESATSHATTRGPRSSAASIITVEARLLHCHTRRLWAGVLSRTGAKEQRA
jgi:hypothetical protein